MIPSPCWMKSIRKDAHFNQGMYDIIAERKKEKKASLLSTQWQQQQQCPLEARLHCFASAACRTSFESNAWSRSNLGRVPGRQYHATSKESNQITPTRRRAQRASTQRDFRLQKTRICNKPALARTKKRERDGERRHRYTQTPAVVSIHKSTLLRLPHNNSSWPREHVWG